MSCVLEYKKKKTQNKSKTNCFQVYNLATALYLLLIEQSWSQTPFWEPDYCSLFSCLKWRNLSAMSLFRLLKRVVLINLWDHSLLNSRQQIKVWLLIKWSEIRLGGDRIPKQYLILSNRGAQNNNCLQLNIVAFWRFYFKLSMSLMIYSLQMLGKY